MQRLFPTALPFLVLFAPISQAWLVKSAETIQVFNNARHYSVHPLADNAGSLLSGAGGKTMGQVTAGFLASG